MRDGARKDEAAESVPQLAGVAEGGQEGSHGRGRESEASEDRRPHEPDLPESPDDARGEAERDQPAPRRQGHGPASDLVEVDLESGEEEEKGQAEKSEEAEDPCAARYPQAVWPHENPQEDFHDDDGKAKADGELRDEGRRHRDHRDDEQR